MSKIKRVQLELEEQANELGFETLQEALDAGCVVDWGKKELIDPLTAAHRAHERKKADVLEYLGAIKTYFNKAQDSYAPEEDLEGQYLLAQLERMAGEVIDFIKEGEL